MTLIETIEVGSGGAASVTFSGIPQTGKDLMLKVSYRTDNADLYGNLIIKPNGSTSNLSDRELVGNGSSASTSTGTDGTINRGNGNTTTANTFSNGQIYISNYTSSSAKSISAEGAGETNGATILASIIAMLWDDTSAITSLEFVNTPTSDFMQYSTFSLYIIS